MDVESVSFVVALYLPLQKYDEMVQNIQRICPLCGCSCKTADFQRNQTSAKSPNTTDTIFKIMIQYFEKNSNYSSVSMKNNSEVSDCKNYEFIYLLMVAEEKLLQNLLSCLQYNEFNYQSGKQRLLIISNYFEFKLILKISKGNCYIHADLIFLRSAYQYESNLNFESLANTFCNTREKTDALLEVAVACYIAAITNINLFDSLKNTASDITQTAATNTAALGIESAIQVVGNAVAGAAVSAIVDVAVSSATIYLAKRQKDEGKISQQEFSTKVKKTVCESSCKFVGGTTGSIIGQVFIPVPVVGAFVGGFCGSLIGAGIGKGINYGVFDRNKNKEKSSENNNELVNSGNKQMHVLQRQFYGYVPNVTCFNESENCFFIKSFEKTNRKFTKQEVLKNGINITVQPIEIKEKNSAQQFLQRLKKVKNEEHSVKETANLKGSTPDIKRKNISLWKAAIASASKSNTPTENTDQVQKILAAEDLYCVEKESESLDTKRKSLSLWIGAIQNIEKLKTAKQTQNLMQKENNDENGKNSINTDKFFQIWKSRSVRKCNSYDDQKTNRTSELERVDSQSVHASSIKQKLLQKNSQEERGKNNDPDSTNSAQSFSQLKSKFSFTRPGLKRSNSDCSNVERERETISERLSNFKQSITNYNKQKTDNEDNGVTEGRQCSTSSDGSSRNKTELSETENSNGNEIASSFRKIRGKFESLRLNKPTGFSESENNSNEKEIQKTKFKNLIRSNSKDFINGDSDPKNEPNFSFSTTPVFDKRTNLENSYQHDNKNLLSNNSDAERSRLPSPTTTINWLNTNIKNKLSPKNSKDTIGSTNSKDTIGSKNSKDTIGSKIAQDNDTGKRSNNGFCCKKTDEMESRPNPGLKKSGLSRMKNAFNGVFQRNDNKTRR